MSVRDLIYLQLRKEGITDVKVVFLSQEDFNKKFNRVTKVGYYGNKVIYLVKNCTGSVVAHEIGHAVGHSKGLTFESLSEVEDNADDYVREHYDFVSKYDRLANPKGFRKIKKIRFH